MKRYYSFFLFLFLFSCNNRALETSTNLDAHYLHDWNIALQEAIINDFFSPPVAGRMYTYPNLAVHAILSPNSSLVKSIKGFPNLNADSSNQIFAMYMFYYVAKKMVYSGNYLDDHLIKFETELKAEGYTTSELNAHNTIAKELSNDFLKWVAMDNYKETRSDTKFSLSKKPGAWKPTAPDYMDALEPNWGKIRPFFIDSSNQYTALKKPYLYDMKDKNSAFYKELMEVKTQVDKTNENELSTSKYWDCNPLAPQHSSHVTFAEKKLTPGGHWLSIGRNVSIQKKDNLLNAAKMYALLSLSINDGFIACWSAKYYYDYIRPITAIQDNMNSEWKTLILTPNFPEYPSGHSVVSGVASTVLAALYGSQVTFTDNAEEPFGMTPREFNSFSEACDQAAMSRFYAGIHFRKAIEDGVIIGRAIGADIVKKVNVVQNEN